MDDVQKDILKFWFEETKPAQWFQVDPAFDQLIRQRFLEIYEQGTSGAFDALKDSPQGCLALCIMLDQFPRNMFRGTPKAFASDEKALAIANHAVEQRFDQSLPADRRRFVYLPFEHSENLEDQHTSVALFKAIKNHDEMGYDYAVRHLEVIERYGRFPHRNKILGRDNTSDEEVYLAQAGAGF
jgi:uncharacterized protein (DUF924 family)